jgi:hypothetical protein
MIEKSLTGFNTNFDKPFKAQEGEAISGDGGKRSYSPPRLLSSEPLELAAATCFPPVNQYGKQYSPPSTCTVSQS